MNKLNCNTMQSKLPDVLFETDEMNAEVAAHLAECSACGEQLAELRATMSLMDGWEAPEPNPYFLTRFNARFEEERQAAPAGWFERVKARFTYGPRTMFAPVAAMVMTVVLLVGGGTYIGMNMDSDGPDVEATSQTAVVHDLQTMDNNAQLLDQLESLSNN